jgi:hypothetical protein
MAAGGLLVSVLLGLLRWVALQAPTNPQLILCLCGKSLEGFATDIERLDRVSTMRGYGVPHLGTGCPLCGVTVSTMRGTGCHAGEHM